MARKRPGSATDEPSAVELMVPPSPSQTPTGMPIRHDLVDPTVPAGMVRISDGRRQRFIWPVHLSGWQQQGWSLTAAATGIQITPAPEPSRSEPSSDGSKPEAVASWQLETSSTGEALSLDDPLL
jgi:hypothetical protein